MNIRLGIVFASIVAALNLGGCVASVLDGLSPDLPKNPANTMAEEDMQSYAATVPPKNLRLELGGIDGAPAFVRQDLLRHIRSGLGSGISFYERPGSGARVRLQVIVAGEWESGVTGVQVVIRTRWELRTLGEDPLWRMEASEGYQGKRLQMTTRSALKKIAAKVMPELMHFLKDDMAELRKAAAEQKAAAEAREFSGNKISDDDEPGGAAAQPGGGGAESDKDKGQAGKGAPDSDSGGSHGSAWDKVLDKGKSDPGKNGGAAKADGKDGAAQKSGQEKTDQKKAAAPKDKTELVPDSDDGEGLPEEVPSID